MPVVCVGHQNVAMAEFYVCCLCFRKMASPVPSCPTLDEATRRGLIHRLFKLGAVNFEGVHLKTGELSPVYFDIRLTMSDPKLLVRALSRSVVAFIGPR